MNELIFKDIIEHQHLIDSGKNEMECNLFLLSKFHNISMENIEKMTFKKVLFLMEGLNEYMMKEFKREEFNDKDDENNKINNRAEILDL